MNQPILKKSLRMCILVSILFDFVTIELLEVLFFIVQEAGNFAILYFQNDVCVCVCVKIPT